MVDSRRRDPSREVRANLPEETELWKCDFLQFVYQILVEVLVTLQDLVTL